MLENKGARPREKDILLIYANWLKGSNTHLQVH